MKKSILSISIFWLSTSIVSGQIGINTEAPKSTLDVVGDPANTTKLDGIIAPRLTGIQLRAKTYGTDQNGSIVYVTSGDTSPAGQTIDVVNEGYYYYSSPANKWVKMSTGTQLQTNDWHTTGNTDAEIATVTETLGTPVSSANYLGTKGANDNLVLAIGGNSRAVFDANGSLSGGGSANSALSWGSGNVVASNNASNTIVLGRNNDATAASANFNSIAIGNTNSVVGGATAIGTRNGYNNADDTKNTLNGSSAFAVGRYNVGTAYSFGFNNNSAGYAFGSGNTVSTNGFAMGSSNTTTNNNTVVVGVSGTASIPGQSVYANLDHYFYSQNNSDNTRVVINALPASIPGRTDNPADLYLQNAVNLKISSTVTSTATVPASSSCNSNTVGNMIYWETTGGVGHFYGCRKNGASTYLWTQLNN